MINGRTEQFLDTGWYNEATLFYSGHIYWLEGNTNFDSGISCFHVDRWKADLSEGVYYNSKITKDGQRVGYERIYEIEGSHMNELKKRFLEAPLFDGKSFWQVERCLVWVEEGESEIES